MMRTITNEQLRQVIDRYVNNYGGCAYEITGSLNDNYIITAPGYKTIIIKEVYLSDWCSCNSIKRYNTMPQKYAEVIELLELGEQDRAERKFFS